MKFKVKCTGYKTDERYLTVGKVYTWKDGTLTNDIGFTYTTLVEGTDIANWELCDWYTLEKVSNKKSKKVEVANNTAITITNDGYKTICKRFDNDGRVLSKGVAKCHPDDKFDEEYGAKLAMERMFEDEKSKAKPKFVVGDKVVNCDKLGYRFDNNEAWVVKVEYDGIWVTPSNRMSAYLAYGFKEHDTAYYIVVGCFNKIKKSS